MIPSQYFTVRYIEDDGARFALTPLGTLLRSDAPGFKRSLARMAGAEFYRSWGGLLSSVESGGAPFDKVFGAPFFRYMDANPDRWRIYDSAMTGIHDGETQPVLDAYDFAPFRTIVDECEATGDTSIAFGNCCPENGAFDFRIGGCPPYPFALKELLKGNCR